MAVLPKSRSRVAPVRVQAELRRLREKSTIARPDDSGIDSGRAHDELQAVALLDCLATSLPNGSR